MMRSGLRITTRRALGAAAVGAAIAGVLLPHAHQVVASVFSDRNVKRDIASVIWGD